MKNFASNDANPVNKKTNLQFILLASLLIPRVTPRDLGREEEKITKNLIRIGKGNYAKDRLQI